AKIVEFLDNTSEVLTVACPKEAIEEILNLGKDGGFDPEIVSVEGLALANVFERWNASPPEIPSAIRYPGGTGSSAEDSEGLKPAPGLTQTARSKLILCLGHTHSVLLVYREGGLVATRSLLWGGAEVAQALSQAFSVPIFEAVKTLQ